MAALVNDGQIDVRTCGGYIAPSEFCRLTGIAIWKVLRTSLPHFSVKHKSKSTSRKSYSFFTSASLSDATTVKKLSVAFAHFIRQAPAKVAQVVCSLGSEVDIAPLLKCVVDRCVDSRESRASQLQEDLRTIIAEVPHRQEWHNFYILAQLLPLRTAIHAVVTWMRSMITGDEIFIVQWLRSRAPEKWYVGMTSRILLQSMWVTLDHSLVFLLLLRQCVDALQNEGQPLGTSLFSTRSPQTLFCAAAASVVSAAVRFYVAPRAEIAVQRMILWVLEELEYVVMRRYANDAARLNADDVDDSFLTEDERCARNARLETRQRGDVLRALAMRSVALVITHVLILHPLRSFSSILDTKAVLWITGVGSLSPANEVSVLFRRDALLTERVATWFRWSMRQLSIEAEEIVTCLSNSACVMWEPDAPSGISFHSSGFESSIQLLMDRLRLLLPLYEGWQWKVVSALSILHLSTLGRLHLQ